MNGFKLLIDTNVVIGLEDAQPVQASLAELVRLSSEHGIGLFVDGANYDDVARDKNETRRAVTLSKLTKFQQLRGIPLPAETGLIARFGAINNDNDGRTLGSWRPSMLKPPISLSLRISASIGALAAPALAPRS